jgi:hypothetical protein
MEPTGATRYPAALLLLAAHKAVHCGLSCAAGAAPASGCRQQRRRLRMHMMIHGELPLNPCLCAPLALYHLAVPMQRKVPHTHLHHCRAQHTLCRAHVSQASPSLMAPLPHKPATTHQSLPRGLPQSTWARPRGHDQQELLLGHGACTVPPASCSTACAERPPSSPKACAASQPVMYALPAPGRPQPHMIDRPCTPSRPSHQLQHLHMPC